VWTHLLIDRSRVNPKVTIIADDLTGALDVAGPFASRGHRTWVVVDEAKCDPTVLQGAEVVSINSASRHLAPALAAECIRRISGRLCSPDSEVSIKKIDSTLRGNVAAETLAMMHTTGRPNAILAPAFPAQGRTFVDGIVYVNGVPLSRTGFARDALSPPPLQPLDAVFRSAAPSARVFKVSPDGPFELAGRGEGQRIFIVDGQSEADLRRTVEALRQRLSDCVVVGSAGIAAAVAQVCMPSRPARQRPFASGQLLVVVGSRAERSAAQVDALSREEGVKIYAAPNGQLAPLAAYASDAPTIVVRATSAAGGQEGNAEEVAASLARHTAQLLHSRPIGALVATGGDTAIAILHVLAQSALEVMGDLLPGIPYCRLEVDGRPVWLITKAGGFGMRDTFIELARLLHSPS
jgi:uncharacterized protein YgbK (DUF1537 family)